MENDEIGLPCPYCPANKENKLSINIDLGVYNCFRCGFHGRIEWLAKKHPNLFSRIEDSISTSAFARLKAYAKSSDKREIDSSVMRELKSVTAIEESDPHYRYLLDRGWTEALISLYVPLKTNTLKFSDRVIIPVTDVDNKVVYFTARDITGIAPRKYINPVADKNFVFTTKTPVDSVYVDDAFICEGIFDAFKIPGACALLGKTLNKAQHSPLYNFLKKRKNIYICFDPGTEKESERLAIELDSWFMNKTIKVMNWVSDRESSLDLGEVSKVYTYSKIMRFIKENSHDAQLLKLL
jgi:hypothetical protein